MDLKIIICAFFCTSLGLLKAELFGIYGIPESELAGSMERLKNESLEYLQQLNKKYINAINRTNERERELRAVIDSVLKVVPTKECKNSNETTSTIKNLTDKVTSLNNNWRQCKLEVKNKNNEIAKLNKEKNSVIKKKDENISSMLKRYKNSVKEQESFADGWKKCEDLVETKLKEIDQLTEEKNSAIGQWKMSNSMVNTTIKTFSSTIKNLTDQVKTLTNNIHSNDQTCEKNNAEYNAQLEDLTSRYTELNNTYQEETKLLKHQLKEKHRCPVNETEAEQCRLSKIIAYGLQYGYTYTEGIGMHKIHTYAMNYTDAEKVCISEDAHLSVISSLAEEKLLVNMILKRRSQLENILDSEQFRDQAYIGFNDLKTEGKFVTSVRNQPLSQTGYGHWATYKGRKQPSGGRKQNCVALLAVEGYGMNDVECDTNLAFICELNAA